MVDAQIIKDAIKAIVEHDEAKAIEITKKFIEAGNNPLDIMTEGFIPGIGEVGDQFGRGLLFLPGLVQSADVMKTVTNLVNDALPEKKLEKP
ncbi:MAG: B12-binding domain-containing protein, partial [Deltaproteobacteria bacterium]|nr:B12-binding domain-containing protein [Deltaproteobacteria bacterium]